MTRRSVTILLLAAAVVWGPDRARGAVTPEVQASVEKAVGFLKKQATASAGDGRGVLCAYALLKAGEAPDSPAVAKVLAAVRTRCDGETYQPEKDHFYTAGLELMLLADADPEGMRPEMEKILAYVLAGQQEYGAWYYPMQQGLGDTSITQYSVLGLWAAERAGLTVPRPAWDAVATWHIRLQVGDGGFGYHPTKNNSGDSTATMSAAGTANLLLARRHLYPEAVDPGHAPPPKQAQRFGLLVELTPTADGPAAAAGNYVPRSTRAAIESAAVRGLNWSALRFRPGSGGSWPLYYLYGIERMASLANVETLGPTPWYETGAADLVKTQASDGSWAGDSGGTPAGTAFAVLFLVRATGKALGRIDPPLAGGLLSGGRGLPTGAKSGTEKPEPAGSLADLLARLENPAAAELPAVQQAVLDAVRFGEREGLIGQRDRLRGLAAHPDPEVRRTAMWALGRSGDLADGGLLIAGEPVARPTVVNGKPVLRVGGLADPDPAVAEEAYNALCVLSRRPLGMMDADGTRIAANPTAAAGEGASQEDAAKAFASWQTQAVRAWSVWYRRVAPYEERDGLGPLPVSLGPVSFGPAGGTGQ